MLRALVLLLFLAAHLCGQAIRFAAIGDFGSVSAPTRDVANLVKSWNPDFVITLGDNNYENGLAATIDANIGQYYHEFIFPYKGAYGPGASFNRFFPSLGNHDWGEGLAVHTVQPYLSYFTLPGNGRYYEYTWGPVHFFAVDSDTHEPDGAYPSAPQAAWLRSRLAAATERWKLVYFHHPPYSSGIVGGSDGNMQWPFQQWGATAVIAGHEHIYERLLVNGFPYFVNGLGGRSMTGFRATAPGSQVRFNADYGAMLVTAAPDRITFEFYTRTGQRVDTYSIDCVLCPPPARPALTAAGIVNAASYLSGGVVPGEIASIFGTNLAATTAEPGLDLTTGRLPVSVAGVSVLVNGMPAPLFYVSPLQINFQIPFELAGQSVANVTVQSQGVAGNSVSIPVVAADPGIFASPAFEAAAFNQDGSVNGPGNPAAPGTVISLFATGLGPVSPPVATGLPAPLLPLSNAAFTVNISMGGQDASVTFAGLAPGFAGLFQINALVPPAAPTGPAIPVTTTVNGRQSRAATVAIR